MGFHADVETRVFASGTTALIVPAHPCLCKECQCFRILRAIVLARLQRDATKTMFASIGSDVGFLRGSA